MLIWWPPLTPKLVVLDSRCSPPTTKAREVNGQAEEKEAEEINLHNVFSYSTSSQRAVDARAGDQAPRKARSERAHQEAVSANSHTGSQQQRQRQ